MGDVRSGATGRASLSGMCGFREVSKRERMRRGGFYERQNYWFLAAAAMAGQAQAEEGPLPKEFEAIETIVVVFLENRSFVNLLPRFPGALGIAQSPPEFLLQRDRDGSASPIFHQSGRAALRSPIAPTLPRCRTRHSPSTKRLALPRNVLTVSPVHQFYQNRMQINGGKNDMFVAWTDVGSLVMGHYNPEDTYLYKLAKEFALTDQFFMAAFGGSDLNHFWLACACAPIHKNAPTTLRAELDAAGI